MKNTSLLTAINTVLSQNSPTLTVVTLEIISSSDPTYTFSPMMINELRITQKFNAVVSTDSNYSDMIIAQFDIAASDYANIYDRRQDLMAILTFNFCDNEGRIISKVKPTKITYRAIPLNLRDLRKEMPDVHHRVDLDSTMTLQLVDPVAYILRLKSINTIYRAMSMSQIIRHVCGSVGVTSLNLTAPDSDAVVFDQVIIPPYRDFSNIFGYLQGKYGVYMNGICQYVTNGVAYVYAPYDTNPKTPNVLTVYQGEQGQSSGANSFHRELSNGDYQVVINTTSSAQDLSVLGAENVGTSHMFLRAAERVDGLITADQQGNITFNQSTSVAVRVTDPTTASTKNVNNRYMGTTNNMFAAASKLVSHRAIIVNAQWSHAIPLSLSPGQAVVYYSDEEGKVRKRTGITEGVDYGLRKVFRSPSGMVMACLAHLTLRLDPVGTVSSSVG